MFLKKVLNIKEFLPKELVITVSTIVTNYFLSTIVADHCASAIFFPSTNASPLYFQTLPCERIASIFSSSLQSGITGFLNPAFLPH